MRIGVLWIFGGALVAGCGRAPAVEGATPGPVSLGRSVDTPLRRLTDGYYATVSLGHGRSGLFLVDTGSYRCFATVRGEALLREAGATVGKRGELSVPAASIGSSKVGAVEFAPWGKNQDTMDPKSDGILGLDFLTRYTVGLDLKRRVMRLWSSESDFLKEPLHWLYAVGGTKPGGRPPENISKLDLRPIRSTLSVPVTMDGQTLEVIPDVGAGDTYVSARKAKRMGWGKPVGSLDTHFYYGAAHLKEYKIHSLKMGDIWYEGKHSVYVPQNDENQNILGRDALTGVGMLFVFSERMLILVPNNIGENRSKTR
jgi:hypothetical protein